MCSVICTFMLRGQEVATGKEEAAGVNSRRTTAAPTGEKLVSLEENQLFLQLSSQ